jgi:hypothetical protein
MRPLLHQELFKTLLIGLRLIPLHILTKPLFLLFFTLEHGTETSVSNCLYSLRNNAEEHSSHPLRGGSLKSRKAEASELENLSSC